MNRLELFIAILRWENFQYMFLFALLYILFWMAVLGMAMLCWKAFRALVRFLSRRFFDSTNSDRSCEQHPVSREVTSDDHVDIRLFEPFQEDLKERMEFWREMETGYSESIIDVVVDEEEDDLLEVDLVEEGDDLPSDDDYDGEGAPESEEEETDACFPAVVDDGDDDNDDPVEPVEVGDYNNSDPPPLEQQQEPLGLERSSVNGWRSVRLARKPRVSYLGMC